MILYTQFCSMSVFILCQLITCSILLRVIPPANIWDDGFCNNNYFECCVLLGNVIARAISFYEFLVFLCQFVAKFVPGGFSSFLVFWIKTIELQELWSRVQPLCLSYTFKNLIHQHYISYLKPTTFKANYFLISSYGNVVGFELSCERSFTKIFNWSQHSQFLFFVLLFALDSWCFYTISFRKSFDSHGNMQSAKQ